MIVTRTPFRVTLGGGGTDLPSYYERFGGFVLAMAIDKYMYVAMNPPLVDRKIRVKYTKSETVDRPEELNHELVREALIRHGILSRMEISSIADLPSGTGLGSSSAFLVGLLTAIRAYRREPCALGELAEEACAIELQTLRKPIGKQDQYLAAFGGITVLDIARDGRVEVRVARTNTASLADFTANTHLYWTGVARSTPAVLRDQDAAMRDESSPEHAVVRDALHRIKEIGHKVVEAFEAQEYDEFGRLMDEHWRCKKELSPKIAIPGIDALYAEIKQRFGVLGAKLSGPGGGGFLMVYAPKKHRELTEFMDRHGLSRMHYDLEFEGSKVISNTSSSSSGLLDHGPVPDEGP